MRIEGRLNKWNDDRGFGFIAPDAGGPEVFVHVSTFPKDGIRPKFGERLSFEIETGNGNRKQAKNLVCLDRSSVKQMASRRTQPRREASQDKSWVGSGLALILIAGIGFYGYNQYTCHARSSPPEPQAAISAPPNKAAQPAFRCDGRTHCSQMTSCAEASFFLRNCPDVKMDGNNDGVPCEQQWCNGPFAR